MSENIYAVFGAGGFGREVMPLARDIAERLGMDPHKVIFVDDNPASNKINGHCVYTYDEFISIESGLKNIVVAVSSAVVREEVTNRCLSDNVNIWSINSYTAIIMDEVAMGAGSIICPNVIITSNVIIGESFHANINSYVAHDCVIGNYVTFAPCVMCNGNVIVEDNAYIGTGAMIRQGRPGKPIVIGEGATVGMGAVVTKSVKSGTTVVGNPATVLSRKNLRR